MSYKINGLHNNLWGVSITFIFLFLVLFAGSAFAKDGSDAVPAEFELRRFGLTSAGNGKKQIITLWITPKSPYSMYAHDSGGGGLPLTVRAALEGSAEALPVFYVPGTPKPDPLDPSVSVNTHSGKTPVFIQLPDKNSGAALRLSLLLCSNENCVPVRKKWTVPEVDDSGYAALPDAEKQPWWPLFLRASASSRVYDGPGASGVPDFGVRLEQKEKGKPETDSDGQAREVRLVDSWGLEPRYARPGLEVGGLAMAVLLGLCAGALLNVMPCVLPVITLKLSAFAAAAGTTDEKERVRRFRRHNVFFSAGILAWFAILSFALGGGNSMWGQFFQQPWLVGAVLALVFILSLSLFGLYSLPLLQFGRSGEEEEGPRAAFAAGFFATILATPCSGPLLGGVLGYAFRQPPLISAAVFMSIGVGMALPYLLLAIRPGLAARFPKPGPWLRVVGKIVAFLLLATCGYLFLLLPLSWRIPAVLIMLLFLPLLALWGRFRLGACFLDTRDESLWKRARAALIKGKSVQAEDPNLAPRWKELAVGAVVVAAALFLIAGPEKAERGATWETFRAAEFNAALGTVPLLVDFTADWCPNCKVLEHSVLTNANLEQWRQRYGLRLVKVDLSRDNPAGQAFLERLGSSSIPIVAIFPAGEEKNRPLVLRDLFGKTTLEKALGEILTNGGRLSD